jgi:hypothetical protein
VLLLESGAVGQVSKRRVNILSGSEAVATARGFFEDSLDDDVDETDDDNDDVLCGTGGFTFAGPFNVGRVESDVFVSDDAATAVFCDVEDEGGTSSKQNVTRL